MSIVQLSSYLTFKQYLALFFAFLFEVLIFLASVLSHSPGLSWFEIHMSIYIFRSVLSFIHWMLTYIQLLTCNLHLNFSRISQIYKTEDQILDLPSCPNLLTFQGLCIGEWHLPLHLTYTTLYLTLQLWPTGLCSSNGPCCLPQKDVLFSLSETLPLVLSSKLGFIFLISTQTLLHKQFFLKSQCTLGSSDSCSHRTI